MEKLISRLPLCPIRYGRFYDGKAVLCCGYREVEYDECVGCGTIIKKLNL